MAERKKPNKQKKKRYSNCCLYYEQTKNVDVVRNKIKKQKLL